MLCLPRWFTVSVRAALVLGIAVACQSPPALVLDGEGVFALPGDRPDRHRLRYVDGQVSRNEACAIQLENRLNHRVPPLYVNGRPVGFC